MHGSRNDLDHRAASPMARAVLPGDMLYCYKLGMKIALSLAVFLALAPLSAARAAEGKIAVVAAENFYGDIARQIGGTQVAVVSIMNNPDQDPHLFETTPGIVRQLAGAQIAIVNGANYDPWMEKLLAAAPQPNRTVIIAADLMHRKAGD